MELFVHFSEVLVGHMCVYLGSAYVAMPKHRLNTAYVSAVHEKVSSKTMSHSMRADVLGDACESCIAGNDTLNAPC